MLMPRGRLVRSLGPVQKNLYILSDRSDLDEADLRGRGHRLCHGGLCDLAT